jgi:uncharacterized protein with HEPN domain
MRRRPGQFIEDILAQMDRIERFLAEMSLEDMRDDDRTALAVIKAFEIMGEAAKQVPEDVRVQAPEVMWREMAGMRDRLAHVYWEIELAFVWKAVRDRFPIERPALQRLLDELDVEDEVAK